MLRLGKTAGEDEQTHLGDMWVGMVCQSGGGWVVKRQEIIDSNAPGISFIFTLQAQI